MIQELYPYIELIDAEYLRRACYFVIANNINQLKEPSSSTGLHHQHNNDELKEWGQLLHVKKVVQTCLNAARRYNLKNNREIDIIIVAALLHDLPYKFDLEITDGSKMNKNHALDNAKYIENILIDFECHDYAYKVSDMIAFHMGKWNDYTDEWYDEFGKDKENEYLIKILREGDYFSSRNDIGINVNIETCKNLIEQIKEDIVTRKYKDFTEAVYGI